PVTVTSRSSTPSRAVATSTRMAPAPGFGTTSLGAGATSACLQPTANDASSATRAQAAIGPRSAKPARTQAAGRGRATSAGVKTIQGISFSLIPCACRLVNGPRWAGGPTSGMIILVLRHQRAPLLAAGLAAGLVALALPTQAHARERNKPK